MDASMELQNYDKVKVEEKNFQYESDMTRINNINSESRTTQLRSRNFAGPMRNLEEFIEISKSLCSILPPISQSSLFEVDDLLYNEQIKEGDENLIRDRSLYCHIKASLYNRCCIGFMKDGVRNVYMDAALMKLAEHMPVVFENWACQHLLRLKDVYSTCVALKIMVAGAHNKIEFDYKGIKYCDNIQLYMEYLKQIPPGYSLNGKRFSNFIKQHAALYQDLTKGLNVSGFDFIKASIVKMISERYYPSHEYIYSLIDTVIKFNSSERDRLPNYIFELMKGTDESVQEALKRIHHSHDAQELNTLPQKLMKVIVDHIITDINNLGRHILQENYEEKMELIDAVDGYKIEPYYPLFENKYFSFNKPSISIEAVKNHISDKELQARKLSYEKEDHIIFEKFFVYDVFMKKLHGLSIFHELFMEIRRRFKIDYPESYVYQDAWCQIPAYGLIPWFARMIVMKCPFLFKSSEWEIMFKDITSEEKEFIDKQKWAVKISKEVVDGYNYKYVDKFKGMSFGLPCWPRSYRR